MRLHCVRVVFHSTGDIANYQGTFALHLGFRHSKCVYVSAKEIKCAKDDYSSEVPDHQISCSSFHGLNDWWWTVVSKSDFLETACVPPVGVRQPAWVGLVGLAFTVGFSGKSNFGPGPEKDGYAVSDARCRKAWRLSLCDYQGFLHFAKTKLLCRVNLVIIPSAPGDELIQHSTILAA